MAVNVKPALQDGVASVPVRGTESTGIRTSPPSHQNTVVVLTVNLSLTDRTEGYIFFIFVELNYKPLTETNHHGVEPVFSQNKTILKFSGVLEAVLQEGVRTEWCHQHIKGQCCHVKIFKLKLNLEYTSEEHPGKRVRG